MSTDAHSLRISRPTLIALVILGIWFGLDFVGVPRLVDREPLLSLAGLMLALLIAFFVCGLRRIRFAAPIYALSLLVWLGLQIETHWGTYLFSASERKLAWYGRAFGGHVHLLPQLPGRTTPDAYHTLLAALIVANLAFVLRDLSRGKARAST